MSWRHFTDKQWENIKVHLPPPAPRPKGGRPRVEARKCFEGILWILWTGAPWSELPKEYGSPSTCWRRLQQWEQDGTLLEIWRAFLTQLQDKEKIRWNECFADGSFAPAKKGDSLWVRPNAGRERSGWYWSMARVLRWEHSWTRRPHQKSSSLRKRSTPSR
jgi:transposase